MSKQNWKNVIIATLKVIKLIIESVLQKHEEKAEKEKEINLLLEN